MERVVGGGPDPPGIAKQNRNYPSNLDSRGEDKLASTPHSIGSYRSLTTEPELERRWTYQRRRKQQREEEEGLLLVAGSDNITRQKNSSSDYSHCDALLLDVGEWKGHRWVRSSPGKQKYTALGFVSLDREGGRDQRKVSRMRIKIPRSFS